MHSRFASLALLFLFGVAKAILLLQIPGVNLNFPCSGTVEVEFLDMFGAVQYSIKGEYAVPGYESVAVSNFYPPKLLKRALAIKSMRIKSGEVGMTVKVYGSVQETPPAGTTQAVPALTLLMKTGFSNANAPLNVPFDHDQQLMTLPEMDVNYPNQSQSGIKSPGGFYIQQIEVQLQRAPSKQKEAVLQYVPLGEVSGGSQSNELAAAINNNNNGPSVNPRDSVMLGSGPQAQPMIIQQPAKSAQTPPLNSFVQIPNGF